MIFSTTHNTPKILISVHKHVFSEFEKQYRIKKYLILYCTENC